MDSFTTESMASSQTSSRGGSSAFLYELTCRLLSCIMVNLFFVPLRSRSLIIVFLCASFHLKAASTEKSGTYSVLIRLLHKYRGTYSKIEFSSILSSFFFLLSSFFFLLSSFFSLLSSFFFLLSSLFSLLSSLFSLLLQTRSKKHSFDRA